MHQTARMEGIERGGGLFGDGHRLRNPDWVWPAHEGCERAPFDQFHCQIDPPIRRAGVEHLNDVAVANAGEGASLVEEARACVRLLRQMWMQDFERHLAVEHRVIRPVDGGETAGAERAADCVPADDVWYAEHHRDSFSVGRRPRPGCVCRASPAYPADDASIQATASVSIG